MSPDDQDSPSTLPGIVADYRATGDMPRLFARLRAVMRHDTATPEALAAAVEPYRDIPEVAGPIYEAIVEAQPANARALVILANAYWLAGRGPDVVGELASRAMEADPANRGAWHLWALTATSPRERMSRWDQVAKRFTADDLARAALADNAASVASSDNDPVALKLALDTFRDLLTRARPAQRIAIEQAIATLAPKGDE